MLRERLAYLLIVLLIAGLFAAAGLARAAPLPAAAAPQPTPSGHIASPEELALARAAWAQSEHAATFDQGMGANTTCASCKSPRNWDPANTAGDAARDCASCKRIPGAARPELAGGVAVAEADWQHVSCDVCHIPAGESFYTSVAFWDGATNTYAPVENVDALCRHCHEGRHGFEVVGEQQHTTAHQGWACTRCHGAHNTPVSCTDCHDPTTGAGALEHDRHPGVHCSACHDAGGLSVWQDEQDGEYITLRFAHALSSWPSHNLQRAVDCRRCHHPEEPTGAVLVDEIGCEACHAGGAVLYWCTYFQRDPDPLAATPAAAP